jgi:CelD/BcsL family acetyltransferase involved in cellulose biosynthesis
MKVTVIPGRELDDDLASVWKELQRSNPDLASPFFHPEFTRIVASVRNDVEVGVIEDGGKVIAFFPFQREGRDIAGPVGGIISDYQGLICAPDFSCDPRELIAACRLTAWHFDHLIASQTMFSPFCHCEDVSPRIELCGGFDEYANSRRTAGSEQIKKCANALRRLEREIGPVRCVASSVDIAAWKCVTGWKSAQYVRTGKEDLLSRDWIKAALNRIRSTKLPDFAGVLSVLYAGDVPVAGHFGMRSQSVWHYWFPAYSQEYARYSPGLVLLLKMAERAGALGLQTIDLGKGPALYKERFRNAEVALATGSVDLAFWRSLRASTERRMRSLIAGSSIEAPLRRTVRLWRRRRGGADARTAESAG